MDLTFASEVARLGMLLRDSDHRGDLSGTQLLELARAYRGPGREGHWSEFTRLAEAFLSLP